MKKNRDGDELALRIAAAADQPAAFVASPSKIAPEPETTQPEQTGASKAKQNPEKRNWRTEIR
ncbi:MAG: hypothetical protein WB992_17415 [Bryobacteraceae bacterium]